MPYHIPKIGSISAHKSVGLTPRPLAFSALLPERLHPAAAQGQARGRGAPAHNDGLGADSSPFCAL